MVHGSNNSSLLSRVDTEGNKPVSMATRTSNIRKTSGRTHLHATDSGYHSNTSSDNDFISGKSILKTTASSGTAKFCHECGRRYPTGHVKFCSECGIRKLTV